MQLFSPTWTRAHCRQRERMTLGWLFVSFRNNAHLIRGSEGRRRGKRRGVTSTSEQAGQIDKGQQRGLRVVPTVF
ncbi:hypothetical protein CLAIMM_08369 [Cladophialophora immunda]|nr:hypothetical protein CLAIMM_08369 [Cladophialophora immunda]